MSESPFKSYVTALYSQPEAGSASLLLQDRCGADILVLMSACYAATALDAPMSALELKSLSALVAPWQTETVMPLRHVRRNLKTGWPDIDVEARLDLRRALAKLELQAEWIQAALIEKWLAARPPSPEPLPLAAALRHLAPTPGADVDEACRQLEVAAFGTAAPKARTNGSDA